ESMGDREAAAMVRSHHECWDGSGYPDGLRGDAIPAGARILAVADCLAVLPWTEAREALRRRSGTVFDPAIVPLAVREGCEIDPGIGAAGWLEPIAKAARQGRLVHELIAELGNSLNL